MEGFRQGGELGGGEGLRVLIGGDCDFRRGDGGRGGDEEIHPRRCGAQGQQQFHKARKAEFLPVRAGFLLRAGGDVLRVVFHETIPPVCFCSGGLRLPWVNLNIN